MEFPGSGVEWLPPGKVELLSPGKVELLPPGKVELLSPGDVEFSIHDVIPAIGATLPEGQGEQMTEPRVAL